MIVGTILIPDIFFLGKEVEKYRYLKVISVPFL